MKNKYRDTFCGTITEEYIDKKIKVAGFVENIRDHGGILFVDLRDEYGTIQLVSNDDNIFLNLSKESSIMVEGKIRKREEEDYNLKIKTGKIELLVDNLTIFNKADILPFEIKTSHEVNEETRLKYRYLDLRNKKIHDNIIFRSKVLKFLRQKMDSLDFTEIETPIITASSPEGARDFLIPSRKFQGQFYALPQAPQIFKELLMVGGFNKYYQVAPCFRDEDLRSDRTMEFYQLDLEMAFALEEDVIKIGEDIFYDTFKHFSNKEVSTKPFKRISYKEAMLKYGTDKPDLRNPLIIKDISSIFENSAFKPFNGSIVRAIKVDDIALKSNSWFNDIVDYAKKIEMPGIGYIQVMKNMIFKGPIDKFLTDDDRQELIKQTDLKENSVIFFIADKEEKIASKQAGLIRKELGRRLNLINKNKFEFCIINDFPLFEYNEEERKYDFCHNPFSMPKGGINSLKKEQIENILAYQFDFVCNGNEMASGAVRNHDIKSLEKAFEMVGYEKDTLKEKFKSLYDAFHFGAPPHAGMAPGIDRMLMILLDEPNIREVQAFPISTSGEDKMMNCPNFVSEKQLREVHIKLR